MIGLANSTILGYGAVYAASKELDLLQISIFMMIINIFGALFQWPIGILSDRIDRRIILIGITLIASGLSVFLIAFSYLSLIIFFIILAFYAGMCLPMYSLAIAHINDFIQPDEIIAASSTFAIVYGIGLILGPIFSSYFMKIIGTDGFFVFLFFTHLCLGLFGIYRMAKRTKPTDLKSQYVPLPRNISSAGMELNPKAEIKEE